MITTVSVHKKMYNEDDEKNLPNFKPSYIMLLTKLRVW